MDLNAPPTVVTLPSCPLEQHCSERDLAASSTGQRPATLLPPCGSFSRQFLPLVILTGIGLSAKEAVGTFPRMCPATRSQSGSTRVPGACRWAPVDLFSCPAPK